MFIPTYRSVTTDTISFLSRRRRFFLSEKSSWDARTKNEKMLNCNAQSIYYRYLCKKNNDENSQHSYVKSYFIAITVWMCEEKNLNDLDVENDNDIGKVLAQMWIDYATRLLEKCDFIENLNILERYSTDVLVTAVQTLKFHINLNDSLGLELVQELKQIEPYDYGNINHFLKDYIQDRYILVQFYEIDNQETNNWFQWKKLFIDKDFASDDDDDELVQTSLFHKNEARNKSTISPKLFTSNLCVAVGSKKNSYSSILTIIYSSSIEVRLYAGLLLPTLFEHNLSFIFNNRTVLTGHVEGSSTHDLLDNSNLNYAMTITIINNLDIKCPHLGKLFLSSTILKLLIDYQLVLQEMYSYQLSNDILSTVVCKWLCQKSNENSDHDGIFYSDWCLLLPLFSLRNRSQMDRFSCLSDKNII
ncbi:unnamed protein product [Didymodactylos carnosus]|uniref:Uncharacterized protein n=1 Tax=Didymodactylos carnosus TaxID=1234261 RepID=A0A814YNM7_9BILA|nr:unnamed protein product [Didymodactylos carnosus]CAF3994188.1 unnamed protein product [Didymodactylos carnosus]